MREPRLPRKIADEPPRAALRKRERAKRDPVYEAVLGARIRAARIAARMSQTALGEAVGISFQQIQKYEIGKDRIAASTLAGIAGTLGVHPGVFYDDSISVPVGPISDVKASFKAADVLSQIRDPGVLNRLLALANVLAEGKP